MIVTTKVHTMETNANTVAFRLRRKMDIAAMIMLKNDHVVSNFSECTCAVNIGTKACSDTSRRTVTICIGSSSMKSAGIASPANANARVGKYWCGIRFGMGVSLYHVAA